MAPLVAPGSTNMRSAVPVWSSSTQAVPFMDTAVTPLRPVPVSVTSVPTLPDAGEKEVMV